MLRNPANLKRFSLDLSCTPHTVTCLNSRETSTSPCQPRKAVATAAADETAAVAASAAASASASASEAAAAAVGPPTSTRHVLARQCIPRTSLLRNTCDGRRRHGKDRAASLGLVVLCMMCMVVDNEHIATVQ